MLAGKLDNKSYRTQYRRRYFCFVLFSCFLLPLRASKGQTPSLPLSESQSCFVIVACEYAQLELFPDRDRKKLQKLLAPRPGAPFFVSQ
jgi:hypothetical protein